MKEKVNEIFDALQALEMKPTPNNVSIMNGVYAFLREIYNEMGETENGQGRDEADIRGRNDD